MKIKIGLLGLFFLNSIIHPIYADQYAPELEADERGIHPITEEEDSKVEKAEEKQATPENLIQLGASISMSPAIVYQDQKCLPKNGIGANLTLKGEVPKAWCNQTVAFNIAAACKADQTTLSSATVSIGKMIKIGYTSTILGYEKADAYLLISAEEKVLQIKNEHTFDWFRLGYAIEKPIPLQVGLFDKHQPTQVKTASEEKNDKAEKVKDKKEDQKGPIQLDDDLKDKKRPFKIKNSFPSIGLNLSVITDDLNIGLSALGRFTDYTHSSDPNAENLPNKLAVTYGGHLGLQYQIIPKKFTITGQGAYVHGLGDYLPGLSAVQSDKERKEMCAAYYLDKDKNELSFIDAWGVGAALAYCLTPEWTLSIRGSYLSALEDSQKPASAFSNQWNLMPKVAYQFNKYFTFSGEYNLGQESRQDSNENKGARHEYTGSIKFSL